MSKRAIGIILAGFLTVFIAFAVRYAYGMLLPHMLPTLGNSKAGAGVVYSSYFIAYTIFSLLLGVLVDRYDARFLLTFFVLVLASGVLLMSQATTLPRAVLFFTLAGIGQSACWVPVVTVVQRWVKESRRGAVLAVVDLGSGSGIAALSLVIPFIVERFGWRGGWVSLGLLATFIGILNFFVIRSHPPDEIQTTTAVKKEPKDSTRNTFLAIFRIKAFWLIGFSYLFICFSILIPFTFLSSHATESYAISFRVATRLITGIAVSGILGKLTLGYLSDTLGRIRIMMVCSVFVASGGLGMAVANGYFFLFFASLIFGFGYGALWPIYAASARDFFPQKYTGSVIGLWTVFLGVGSIISPIITGWTIDQTGRYFWAFLLVLATGTASLVALLPVLSQSRGPSRQNA